MRLLKIFFISLLDSFIISIFFFSFYFPNISFPPIGDILMNYALLFFVFSIPVGMFTTFYLDNIDEAFLSIILTIFISYGISLVYYSFPLFFGIAPFDVSYYYFIYIKFTFVPFFVTLFGLILGIIPGGYISDVYYAGRKIY